MKQKWRKGILGILFIILLVGCSSAPRYTYSGDSEHWEGKVDVSAKDHGKYQLLLTYDGEFEDISTIKELSYSIEMGGFNQEYTFGFSDGPSSKSFKSNINNIKSEVNDGDVIDLKVQWADQEESLQLEKD
ncbi:hypothetical protein Q7A53_10580 [Halobacillus rhizosphaerae]|uniref:hypothetical protein n=1 Tax=Halobacillus rhizosphaerae TaxID=3064889 RepID=UPI00398B7644